LREKANGIQTAIANLEQQISQEGRGAENLFKVIDPAQAASQPVSRLKLFLTAAGVALGLALLACFLYIIILVRRDRAVYTAHDLHMVTNFAVVMQFPQISSRAIPLLIEQPEQRSA
jgi:hypothetical protein